MMNKDELKEKLLSAKIAIGSTKHILHLGKSYLDALSPLLSVEKNKQDNGIYDFADQHIVRALVDYANLLTVLIEEEEKKETETSKG